MLLATALALLLQDVLTDVYCSNKPAAVAPKETITHHFYPFLELNKKTVDEQNLWRRRKCC